MFVSANPKLLVYPSPQPISNFKLNLLCIYSIHPLFSDSTAMIQDQMAEGPTRDCSLSFPICSVHSWGLQPHSTARHSSSNPKLTHQLHLLIKIVLVFSKLLEKRPKSSPCLSRNYRIWSLSTSLSPLLHAIHPPS